MASAACASIGYPRGHLNRRLEDFLQAQLPVLRQHDEQAARGSGGHRGERSELRRIFHAAAPEELGCGTGGRDAEGVDGDDFLLSRMVDERLGLAAPAQRIEHRRGRAEHGAGGIDRVSASLEHHRSRGRRERLSRDRHPVPAVEDRLFGLAGPGRGGEEGKKDERDRDVSFHRHRTPPVGASCHSRGRRCNPLPAVEALARMVLFVGG